MSAHARGTDSLIAASLSDVGRTRKENQDACGEFHNSLGERLLVTADGMGGHAAGAMASQLCVDTVGRVFTSGKGCPAERLRRGFEEANRAVRGQVEKNPALKGMGTTGVALLFANDDTCWLGWVGDSRAYRYRDGRLEALSEDHSLVAGWVRDGVMSAEEAEVHPRRNEIMRAIGPKNEVEVDVKQVDLEPGDRFLLCSDGLCGYLSGAKIAAILGFERPDLAARKLFDKVDEEHGSPDNVTVQIIEVPRDRVSSIASGSAVDGHPEPLDSGRSPHATTHDIEISKGAQHAGATTRNVDVAARSRLSAEAAAEEYRESASWLDAVRRIPPPHIVYTAAAVVSFALGWASYYAVTTGGEGFPEQQRHVHEEAELPQVAATPARLPSYPELRANVRAEERRRRIEQERLALAKSRRDRQRLRAEAENGDVPAQLPGL